MKSISIPIYNRFIMKDKVFNIIILLIVSTFITLIVYIDNNPSVNEVKKETFKICISEQKYFNSPVSQDVVSNCTESIQNIYK